MMTDLVQRASRVGETSDTLAGAFLVTELLRTRGPGNR